MTCLTDCVSRFQRLFPIIAVATILLYPQLASAQSVSIAECQEMLRVGQYARCLEATAAAIEARSYGEEWPILKAQCELTLGRYPESLETIKAGLERYSWSVRLRMMEFDAAFANGKPDQAAAALLEVERLVQTSAWRYTDADDLVSLGQAALKLGADAKAVQEGFFERARRNFATRPDGFLAAGLLANSKGDFKLAAEILGPAAKDFATNPEILFAYSETLRTGDKPASLDLLNKVLEINPVFAPALHRVAETQIDAEDYSAAETTLAEVLKVNPHSPESHGLQAVIHHLRYAPEAEAASREAAMKFCLKSAPVDHLIGRKLSQKYRFAEGSAYQRRALQADPDFVEAQIQLAQDLLRLGNEDEGWQIADAAQKRDAYNTTLFNLLQLKDSMDKFSTLTSDRFHLRMEKREAAVYGQQAMDLLERVYAEMVERYQFTPQGPIVVEIFPRADDFAVRTFGIPDVAGFLGVCFGQVITANSPASRRENPSNWEAILWHEFCHVITLQMTGNRIPRWLSEGISVCEERRKDARWGQRMTPDYRDRVLAGKITPVSELSSAFLKAESGEDLNFAYYQSSMVVEHIVAEHGMEAIVAILKELNSGVVINDALARHTNGLDELETSFADSFRKLAENYAPAADFAVEGLKEQLAGPPSVLEEFVRQNPGHFPAGLALASRWVKEKRTDDAERQLRLLIELVPDDASTNGPRRLLADLYRASDRLEQEAEVLREHLKYSADDLAAVLRLQELMFAQNDYTTTTELGHAVLAIDPFQPPAIQKMAEAAEKTQNNESAARALSSLLELQPDDGARLHYRIASLLRSSEPDVARRHILLSLQQAPRYRDAHQLLLTLVAERPETVPAADPPAAAPPTPPSASEAPGVKPAELPGADPTEALSERPQQP